MINILLSVEQPLILPPKTGKPFVILMVGINGAGKTTIGKLAKRFQAEGRSQCWRRRCLSKYRRWSS
ncbi:MAG: hypothetical protein R3E08_11190 [Thiotrichaceae bacterium]